MADAQATVYPRLRGHGYWLVSKISPYGDKRRVPVLEAIVVKRRVRRLILKVGAEGD